MAKRTRQKGLTPEQLKELEEYAGLQFNVSDLAVLINADVSLLRALLRDAGTEASLAYDRGRLKVQAAVRLAIQKAAENGSTPAQKIFVELMEAAQDDLSTLRREDDEDLA